MADNNNDNTQQVDAGPPPWEQEMNPVTKAANVVQDVVQPVASAIKKLMPWDMDFAYKAPSPLTMGVEPQGPLPTMAPSADKVFNKMLTAESNNQHYDASGGLLTSSAGAQGISQLMPATAKNPGYGITPVQNNSPQEYIRVGSQLLNAYTKDLGGDIRKGVAAYNYGVGNVKDVISKYGDKWERYLPTETKKYLAKVLGQTDSRSFEGKASESEAGISREDWEKTPSITASELFSKGLDTQEGRNAYAAKMEQEWKDGANGKTKAQLDKYFSNWKWMAKTKDPAAYAAYSTMEQLGGNMPEGVKSQLSAQNTKISFGTKGSTAGFVFSNKGDRVFIGAGADWQTLSHESEHLSQQADMSTDQTKSPTYRFGTIGNMDTPSGKMFTWASKNVNSPEVKEVFPASNAMDSSNEYLANFVGYWKSKIQDGKSWKDTAFFQKLSKEFGKEKAIDMITETLMYAIKSPSVKGK